MPSVGTLYTIKEQYRGYVIQATAAQAGLEIELAPLEIGEANKSPEILAKFPIGRIPAWEGADGFKLYKGSAIARYLASIAPNSGLLGGNPEDAALIDQWAHIAETGVEVDYYDQSIRYLSRNVIPYNKAAETIYYQRLENGLSLLESHLATRTFFVGERITLADLTVAASIHKAISATIDASRRAKYPNLMRHLETVVNQPKLKEIYPAIQYTEKQIQFVPPAKEKGGKTAQ